MVDNLILLTEHLNKIKFMILSFHPLYAADQNITCAGRDPGAAEMQAIQAADAVILPQGCRESLYGMARDMCPHVFPNYDVRFQYSGKCGQAQLFQESGVPHPATRIYRRGDLHGTGYGDLVKNPPFYFPFVFKFDWGGDGETVFLIDSVLAFEKILDRAVSYEKTGQYGFLLQELIPSQARSLRVVVVHQRFIAYWRIQESKNGFYTNLKKGAKIVTRVNPELQKAGIAAAKQFCKKTKINLAGFDFLFSQTTLQQGKIEPLFLEINYFFGRRGLGGSEAYYRILHAEINNWTRHLNPDVALKFS
jgi:ribosomal protein S6--L-glutamate ligase